MSTKSKPISKSGNASSSNTTAKATVTSINKNTTHKKPKSGGGKSTTTTKTNPKKNSKPKTPSTQQQQQQQQTKQTKQQQKQSTKPSKPKQPPQKATDPPIECTHAEFAALLEDAKGLASYEEACQELLDCARYGEVDAVRAILDVWSGAIIAPEGEEVSKTRTTTATASTTSTATTTTNIVNTTDPSRTTSLHKASANKHTSTVQLLLSRGAFHFPNDSGNTPLHWAAGAGHARGVKLILDHYDALLLEEETNTTTTTTNNKKIGKNDDKVENVGVGVDTSNNTSNNKMDVLLKNKFGRSALTEGFTSGDTPTVEALLNHDSAEEERLIGGLDGQDVEEGDEEVVEMNKQQEQLEGEGGDRVEGGEKKKSKEKKSILHEFDFLRGEQEGQGGGGGEYNDSKSVFIRELPIAHADDPFGQSPIEDTTGLGIWCASLVMARWLASKSMVERMANKSVLELGAGCGVPGLAAAVYGQPKSVTITDLNPETIDNIQHNIELNKNKNTPCEMIGSSIDWGDESTYPSEPLDYVIGSDLIYQKDIVPLLKKVVTGLLAKNVGSFLYVCPEGGRDGLSEFISAMKSEGFECVSEEIAPDVYRENPLKSGDEEDCFLHFHELMGTVYVLYEFRRC